MQRSEIQHSAVFLAACAFFVAGTCLRAAGAVDEKSRDTLAKARQERIAVIGIGDSNQRFGGHGWSRYMAAALANRFGCWGTGLSWCRQTDTEKDRSGLPPKELAAGVFSWWYLADSITERVGWRNGQLCIAADHPMDVTGPLKFRLAYGTFTEGSGSFQPAVRIDQPPWHVIAKTPAPIRSATGSPGMTSCTVEIPADPDRKTPLMFSVAPVSVDIKGPFFGECLEAENTVKQSGIAYHTLYAAGGRPDALHFIFMPSHPIAAPDDPTLIAYREEAGALSAKLPNASCILLSELISQTEMAARKFLRPRGRVFSAFGEGRLCRPERGRGEGVVGINGYGRLSF